MALIQQWRCQDNAANTTVLATVGTNATLLGGDNTSAISVASGPGTALPRSLDLDGTNDRIDISGSSISFASGSAFTVCGWVQPDATASRNIFGVTGTSVGRVSINSSTSITVVSNSFTVGTISTGGVWYHLLVSRTTGNSVRVFLDGVESSTGALTISSTFAPTRIGEANGNRFDGNIADLRVYNSDESANVLAIMAEADLPVGPWYYFQQTAAAAG